MSPTPAGRSNHHEPSPVVSAAEWLVARKELLAKEKALTRARDELATARREPPMVRVETEYVFEGPEGQVTLPDLFDGRRQLIVDHMMWAFDFDEDGNECPATPAAPVARDVRTTSATWCTCTSATPRFRFHDEY